MLDKVKLEKDILGELCNVTMDYYNQTGEKIVMHPLAPDIMTSEINTKIDVIRSMNYFDKEIDQNIKVTGLEAIVKAFSRQIIYHFQNTFALDDLTDVTINSPIEGDIIAYVNGEWKNIRNTSTTTIINEDGEEEEVPQTVPVHNHGIGIVNRLAKFRDSVTGNLISSTITETPLDVSTSLNLKIGGYLEVSDVEHLTTVSDRVLVHNNNRIYYRSVTELINDIVVESHNHNDLYYLKTQLQNSGQAQVHYNNLTNVPLTFVPSNHASNHLYGGSDALFPAHSIGFLYNNGSGTLSWSTINVESLGLDEIFAPIVHYHSASDITSGTLSVARGGTGSNNFTAGYLKANETNAFNTVTNIPWGDLTNVPTTFTPASHSLISSHTVSGLTTGHFLKATGATTFGFAAHGLTHTDVGAQPLDDTLTSLAALDSSKGFVYQTGAATFVKYDFWGTGDSNNVARSDHTHSGYEPTITSGLTTQYWRGDKTWQVLNTSIVPEVTNLYYTDNRVQIFGDTRYSLLTHDHNTTYPTISSVFGNLTSNYLPRYNGSGGFVNSPLYHEGTNHIRLGTYFSMWGSDDNETYLLHNIYYGSSAFRYRETTAAAGASLIQSEGQRIIIRVAPDGIKDDSVIFNNYLLLNNLVLQTQNNFYAGGVLNVAGAGNNIITGNLAIGNFTPAYKLHVGGSAVIVGSLGIANAITSPTNYWNFYVDSAEFGLKDNVATTWPLRILKGAPTNSIRVLANGNVGINTVTPSEKLTVTGNILSTNNVVGNNGCYAYNPAGQGNYIGVFKGAGSLPGYNTSYYPTIKTDYAYMYFANEVTYLGHFGGNTSQKIFGIYSDIRRTSTPDYIDTGLSYSDGKTSDKCKIYLYRNTNQYYGFGIGDEGDVQYHGDAYHDFYINNAPMMRISGSLLKVGTRQSITYNSVGTNYSEGNLELVIDGVNSPGSYPLIGFHRTGIDAMSLVYTGGSNLAVRNHLDATLYNVWTAGNLTGDQSGHYHDSRYYTETELTNGTTALALSSLSIYGLSIESPNYYTTEIAQTLTGVPPSVYPQLNLYTPGNLNLYADRVITVNSSMIMTGGTYCTLRSINGDLGAQNLITIGGCGSSTTISVDTYVGSFFRVTSGNGFLRMVTSRVGRCILIKNSTGTTIDLCPYSNRTDYIFLLANTQSVWAVCTQTDGTTSNWDFFQSVVIPEP